MAWGYPSWPDGFRDFDDTPVTDWARVYQPGDDEWGHYRSEGPSFRSHILAGALVVAALVLAVLFTVRGVW